MKKDCKLSEIKLIEGNEEKNYFRKLMSIEKYTTEAFILREYPQDENDIVYKVWTKDFGIIFVLARSIRKLNAKLRMSIQKHRFLILTIVKGRDIWRLTGVEEIKEDSSNIKYILEIKSIIGETISRFLEEKKSYKKLFEKLKSLTLFIKAHLK